jgi:hypothetical protein
MTVPSLYRALPLFLDSHNWYSSFLNHFWSYNIHEWLLMQAWVTALTFAILRLKGALLSPLSLCPMNVVARFHYQRLWGCPMPWSNAIWNWWSYCRAIERYPPQSCVSIKLFFHLLMSLLLLAASSVSGLTFFSASLTIIHCSCCFSMLDCIVNFRVPTVLP